MRAESVFSALDSGPKSALRRLVNCNQRAEKCYFPHLLGK